MLEQAILDAFPKSPRQTRAAKKKASQAADFVVFTINSNGYLCTKPVEAQRADSSLYGVQCIARRNGSGIANYLANIQTSDVTPI